MEQVIGFLDRMFAAAIDGIDRLIELTEPWQLLAAAVVFLVLCIALFALVCRRGSQLRQLEEEKSRQSQAIGDVERENLLALSRKDEQLRAQQRQAQDALEEKDGEIAKIQEAVEELSGFKEEYSIIPDARTEALRIVREAKDHAYVVSNRTEMEYAEIIDHANTEAEAIRALAQQRLARSHEALKQALARANEIVEEARSEAVRIAKIGVNHVAPQAMIEAPDELSDSFEPQDQAADEPYVNPSTPTDEI